MEQDSGYGAKILEVKQTEIHEKASQSIKSKGWLPNLFRGIVAKAKDFLQNLIRCLFVRGLQDQFNNSDAFNGYLRSAGTNTGHGVNKAYIFTSSREREVFKGENH